MDGNRTRDFVPLNYLLLNDTSSTNNPGCRGTVACLRELLRSSGLKETRSLPFGYGYEMFSDARLQHISSFSMSRWLFGKMRIKRQFRSALSNIDLVIVNAEGTIHHNQATALALLALAELAIDRKLPVYFINGSFQEMSAPIITRVLMRCEVVLAREQHSLAYLSSLAIPANFAPDSLFTLRSGLAPRFSSSSPTGKSCLYTPGVLSVSGGLTSSEVGSHLQVIRQAGYSVVYLVVEEEDQKFVDIALSAGATIVGIADVPWFSLINFLTNYELVVTGRYHITIFSWLARVPVVPMSSNTWKMEGLIEFLDKRQIHMAQTMTFVQLVHSGGVLLSEETLDYADLTCRKVMAEALSDLKARIS